jgi:RNA-dependent RNA polymerase
MGNFDKETNILKKFARKGQCFSTSKYICTLKPEQVEMKVADVKRDGFCFSDGVGYISKELSEFVARKMGYTEASAY